MIKLDLFRLLPDIKEELYEEVDLDCRYTPYRIFVMETRLYPTIYKMFLFNISVCPKSVYNSKTNRMDVYLNISKNVKDGEEEVVLSQDEREIIQKRIDKITSEDIDYALIDIYELHDSFNIKYPFSWFRSILEYTGLNDNILLNQYIKSKRLNDNIELKDNTGMDYNINPFVREEGIYLTFDPDSEYKKYYYNICNFLKERFNEFYSKGIIVLGNVIESSKKEKLIKDWELISIDEDEIVKRIFQPNWKDSRFALNQVDFLIRKIEEDPYIRFLLPDNLVKRHFIIQSIQENNKSCIIEGSYIKILSENLEESQKISSLITYSKSKSKGRLITMFVSRLAEIYLYFEYAEKFKKGECISYIVNNNENPYIFSCLLKENDYTESDNLREKFKNYAISRLIEVSKISKLKNISPHDIIEKEYSN